MKILINLNEDFLNESWAGYLPMNRKIYFVTLCSKISLPKSVRSSELQAVMDMVTDNKI